MKKKEIKKIELLDGENNKWWILLSGDVVISVMTSALPQVFRLKSKLRITKKVEREYKKKRSSKNKIYIP